MAFDRLFSNLTGSPSAQGALGGAASGALVSLLLNKKARKTLGSTALKLGGAAAVAGVGYYAYQQWQKRQSPPPTVATTASSLPLESQPKATPAIASPASPPALPPVTDPLALNMIKTMIAAAHADGKVDDKEMAQLEEAVHGAGLSAAEDAAVVAALNSPPSLEEIAQWPGSPAEAAELYGAALLAVDPDTVAETFYLRRLATALRLPPELVTDLNTTAVRG